MTHLMQIGIWHLSLIIRKNIMFPLKPFPTYLPLSLSHGCDVMPNADYNGIM